MSSPFLRNVRFGNETTQQAAPVFKPSYGPQARSNPFLVAQQSEHPEVLNSIGVNKPLRQPMLLTYIGNKPIFAGSQLFVLT